MNRLARYLLPVATAVVAMQAVRSPRCNPPVERDLVAPPDVKAALQGACYDCHSNATVWPWYSAVAPASWIILRDVEGGRRRLNFSSWGDYADDPGTLARKLDEIAKSVAAGDMAPWYYRMLHPGAQLSEAQRQSLIAWVKRERASETASVR